MKYTVAVITFAAAASAQSLSDIPACAQPCIDSARTQATKCAADDYKCLCDNISALTTAATSCILNACGADVAANQVLPAVQAFCAAVEKTAAPTSAPTSAPTPGTSGSTSDQTPGSTSDATSESTSQPTSEVTSEATSETSAEPTSESTSGSTEESTATSQSSYVVITPAPTNGGGNATGTTSATTGVPTAGAAVTGPIGAFALMVLGAFAIF